MQYKRLDAYNEMHRTKCINNVQRLKWIEKDLYITRCINNMHRVIWIEPDLFN